MSPGRPPGTPVTASRLIRPGFLVEVEVVAALPAGKASHDQ